MMLGMHTTTNSEQHPNILRSSPQPQKLAFLLLVGFLKYLFSLYVVQWAQVHSYKQNTTQNTMALTTFLFWACDHMGPCKLDVVHMG